MDNDVDLLQEVELDEEERRSIVVALVAFACVFCAWLYIIRN